MYFLYLGAVLGSTGRINFLLTVSLKHILMMFQTHQIFR